MATFSCELEQTHDDPFQSPLFSQARFCTIDGQERPRTKAKLMRDDLQAAYELLKHYVQDCEDQRACDRQLGQLQSSPTQLTDSSWVQQWLQRPWRMGDDIVESILGRLSDEGRGLYVRLIHDFHLCRGWRGSCASWASEYEFDTTANATAQASQRTHAAGIWAVYGNGGGYGRLHLAGWRIRRRRWQDGLVDLRRLKWP